MCAPSNGALDEIVGRLLATGLTDSRGRLYMPKLVRVGVSVHHSVAAVSLERLVAERMERAAQVQGETQSYTFIKACGPSIGMPVCTAAVTLRLLGAEHIERASQGCTQPCSRPRTMHVYCTASTDESFGSVLY